MRAQFDAALKSAMLAKNVIAVSTIRMILTDLKNKDVALRTQGKGHEIDEPAILSMLQGMIKQRQESIALYEQGNRQELADKERAEIAVIETFLPKQMTEDEVRAAIQSAIGEVGATSIRDMGKVMAVLKTNYAGTMDFGKAGGLVKAALST